MEVGISGISAVLIAHTAAAIVKGKLCLVAAIVIGERFPEGALEGTALHWGCSAPGRSGNWDPPPSGWHTLPPVSHPAGGPHLLASFLPLAEHPSQDASRAVIGQQMSRRQPPSR